ncbi:hypothetical protein ACFRAR_33055 [Kitasatospora sp. NPDC056651]|uniref:hypothetical protein n=1 Tax=Kitasatospora sp. NPDC056651 TaxID=3345892 RepID=UPI003676715B
MLKAMLATPVVTTEHLVTASNRLGAETVLLEVVRSRYDLHDDSLLLIARLDHAAARRVAESWQYFGPEIRAALITAAAHRPTVLDGDISKLSEADREKLKAAVGAWHDDVWALLSADPARNLWAELVRDEESGVLFANLLLNRAEQLDDHVLLACISRAFPNADEEPQENSIPGSVGAYIRLSTLADIVSRHPRTLLLHGQALGPLLTAVAGELIEAVRKKGVSELEWDAFSALAAICGSPGVLRDAADCLTQAQGPSWSQWRHPSGEWANARSRAADALARNPLCPVDALVMLAPFLSEAVAAQFLQHPDERVRESSQRIVDLAVERVHRAQPATPVSRKQPVRPEVPTDDELSTVADPRTALADFLPLKGPAAYRRETALAILESRYADASHLRELPAVLVLSSTSQVRNAAALLQTELGDRPEAWEAFKHALHRLVPNATKTFGTLIDEVLAAGA